MYSILSRNTCTALPSKARNLTDMKTNYKTINCKYFWGAAVGGAFGLVGQAIEDNISGPKRRAEQQEYNEKNMAIQQGYIQENMQKGYELNEQAADNADARARAMQEDYWNKYNSPAAQRKALEDAGLGIGLMYGNGAGAGGAGGGVSSGAQGGVTGGEAPHGGMPQIPTSGWNDTMKNMGLQMAQIEKIKAETNNINVDTEGKQLDNIGKDVQNDILRLNKQGVEKQNALLEESIKTAKRENHLGEETYQDKLNSLRATYGGALVDLGKKLIELGYAEEEIMARINNINSSTNLKDTEAEFRALEKEVYGNQNRIYINDGTKIGYKKFMRTTHEIMDTFEPVVDGISKIAGAIIAK